jgi:hypothetical protein
MLKICFHVNEIQTVEKSSKAAEHVNTTHNIYFASMGFYS